MWDFTKIFSSSDSLFKFLFVGGVSMIFVALFYPLSRQHELELNKNSLALEEEITRFQIEETKTEVEQLQAYFVESKDVIDSLTVLKSQSKSREQDISDRIRSITEEYNQKYNEVNQLISDNREANIRLEFKVKEVEILKSQVSVYESYTCTLIVVGILIGVFGLAGWGYSTYLTEVIRNQQVKKNELELSELKEKGTETEVPPQGLEEPKSDQEQVEEKKE